MGKSVSSWLRDFGRHYILYAVVGAAFLPAAVVFGVLRSYAGDHWLFVPSALILGFASAVVAWFRLRAFFVEEPETILEPTIIVEPSPFIVNAAMAIATLPGISIPATQGAVWIPVEASVVTARPGFDANSLLEFTQPNALDEPSPKTIPALAGH